VPYQIVAPKSLEEIAGARRRIKFSFDISAVFFAKLFVPGTAPFSVVCKGGPNGTTESNLSLHLHFALTQVFIKLLNSPQPPKNWEFTIPRNSSKAVFLKSFFRRNPRFSGKPIVHSTILKSGVHGRDWAPRISNPE
jgi:hypothetical protein